MKASEIFLKTAKGQSEVASRTNALSMKERRVLILVNGDNNAAKLKELSLCENIVEILETLLSGGFIEQQGGAAATSVFEEETAEAPAASAQGKEPEPAAAEIGAREFMCNTLLTFANRVRVARLLDDINSVEDVASLKNMVKPWYHALSETPGGMYQADDLRKEVNQMIADEEISGLR